MSANDALEVALQLVQFIVLVVALVLERARHAAGDTWNDGRGDNEDNLLQIISGIVVITLVFASLAGTLFTINLYSKRLSKEAKRYGVKSLIRHDETWSRCFFSMFCGSLASSEAKRGQ